MKKKLIILLSALFLIGIFGNASAQPEDEAIRLNKEGVTAHQEGRYEDALKYFAESLKIYKKLDSTHDTAITLIDIGLVYKSLGRYEDALKYYEEALKVFEELKPCKHAAQNLDEIAIVYSILGRYDEALKYSEEALKMKRGFKTPEEQSIAQSLYNIGWIYGGSGRYEEAFKYYNEALTIRKGLNIPRDLAQSLTGTGWSLYRTGKPNEALKHLEEALSIYRQLNIPQETALTINNIGVVYKSLKRYDEALKYHTEALKIRKELNISSDLTQSLNNIAQTYKSLGRHDDALSAYKEALDIFRKLNIPNDIAAALYRTGAIYESLGKYHEALKYYEESLDVVKKLNMPQDEAAGLNDIGLIYYELGQYDKALKYYEEALKINRKLDTPIGIATELDNIGWVYLALKDYKKAEELFKEKEEEEARAGYGWTGNPSLVEVYLATGKYKEALELLEKMELTWFSGSPYRIQYHTQKGYALKGIGQLRDASEEFLSAVSIVEEMRKNVQGEKIGFLSAGSAQGRAQAYRGLLATLSERALSGEKNDKIFSPYGKDLESIAFYFSESVKARVLLEAMAQSAREAGHIELPQQLWEKEQSLIQQISAIDSQWTAEYKKGEEALGRLKGIREKLSAELNELISELRKSYPTYASLYYPKPILAERLSLKDNEVLLEYAIGVDRVYLFMVIKEGVKKVVKLPLSKEALEEKIKAFMEPLNTKQYERFSVEEAEELYELLLAEVLKEVKQGEKIIIVPDGVLGLLPFEALVIEKGKGIKDSLYVGDRYVLSYYQSATVLSFQRSLKSSKLEKPLFALGNPVYSKDDPRYIAWKSKNKEVFVAGVNKYSFRGLAIKPKWGKTLELDIGNEVEFLPLPEIEIEVKEIAKTIGVSLEPPDILLSVNANETELDKRHSFLLTYGNRLPSRKKCLFLS
ncbi:MAG: tetratricopeptide repeat protein [Nitrospirae bacterium]|nr:tetratricopeptide repeat protein [Nitrospirota bacterium]